MYSEILSPKQIELLPFIQKLSPEFYLAGGTAIALQIGHRSSIDFDLFSNTDIQPERMINNIYRLGYQIEHTFTQSGDEFTVMLNKVKITFLYYPFQIEPAVRFDSIIGMPDIQQLAAMKAYALGRRSKWKDYVDIYFLLKFHVAFKDVVEAAKKIYGRAFNERLFREQLCYFDDIDFSEHVAFNTNPAPDDETIRTFLTDTAILMPS